MDNEWERSVPFYLPSIEEIDGVLKEYDQGLKVLDFSPIRIGCRNSNFHVHTNRGDYFFRICLQNDLGYQKERIIGEIFRGVLNVPPLRFVSESNRTNRICVLYEYIAGISMQTLILQKGGLEDNQIVQVAKCASSIHNREVIKSNEFDDDYPPFETWYDLFLENENIAERMGMDIKKRVNTLIADKKKELSEIDRYISFIHADFRPANMLIDQNDRIWIVDWEFSGFGHSLGDIGQFFRYGSCFTSKQLRLFEETYNYSSGKALPQDWYALGKLMDLVNPLQMLGAKENLPKKYTDLKNLVLETLAFFDY